MQKYEQTKHGHSDQFAGLSPEVNILLKHEQMCVLVTAWYVCNTILIRVTMSAKHVPVMGKPPKCLKLAKLSQSPLMAVADDALP